MKRPRSNPLALAAMGLLRAYHAVLSPWLPSACRFYPTCSIYAAQAIERFGFFHGSWLALRRLGHCHPFHAGGFDPVPHP